MDPRCHFELGETGYRWRLPYAFALYPFVVLSINKALIAPNKTYYDITANKGFAIKGFGVYAIMNLWLGLNWNILEEKQLPLQRTTATVPYY